MLPDRMCGWFGSAAEGGVRGMEGRSAFVLSCSGQNRGQVRGAGPSWRAGSGPARTATLWRFAGVMFALEWCPARSGGSQGRVAALEFPPKETGRLRLWSVSWKGATVGVLKGLVRSRSLSVARAAVGGCVQIAGAQISASRPRWRPHARPRFRQEGVLSCCEHNKL